MLGACARSGFLFFENIHLYNIHLLLYTLCISVDDVRVTITSYEALVQLCELQLRYVFNSENIVQKWNQILMLTIRFRHVRDSVKLVTIKID